MLPSAANLDLHHIQAIVRAMHQLALTDGVHDAERVMLRGFYEACQEDSGALTSFDQLIGGDFDIADVAHHFDSDERRDALLQSCVLLAYADGQYSSGERERVASYAKALGVSEAELAAIEDGIGDHLMQQIARIENLDALQEVAGELRGR